MSTDKFYDKLTEAVDLLRRNRTRPAVSVLRDRDAATRRTRTCRSCGRRFAATDSQVLNTAIELGGPLSRATYCPDCVRRQLEARPAGGKGRARRPSRAALEMAERVNARLRRDPDPGGWRTADAEARFDEVGWPDPTGPSARLIADAAAARQRRGGKPRYPGPGEPGELPAGWRVYGSATVGGFYIAHDTGLTRGPFSTRPKAVREVLRWAGELGRARARRGGKLRFDPAQLKKGIAEELEHAATIKTIVKRKLPVKKAAALIAKDHLGKDPHHYDRAEAVAVPKRQRGLKPPRLKLLHRRGALRVYLVDSHKVRRRLPDWTMGGHGRVYFPEVPRNEVWIAEEVFDPERTLCTIHELNEYTLMGGGMSYDEAHDKSTALEQEFRVGGRKDVAATLQRKLKEAAASCV